MPAKPAGQIEAVDPFQCDPKAVGDESQPRRVGTLGLRQLVDVGLGQKDPALAVDREGGGLVAGEAAPCVHPPGTAQLAQKIHQARAAHAGWWTIADHVEVELAAVGDVADVADRHPLDGPGERRHTTTHAAAFEGGSGGAGRGEDALAVADEDLRVGADVHHHRHFFALGETGGEETGGGVGTDVARDQRQAVDPGFRVERQAEFSGGDLEAGCVSLATPELVLGGRAVGELADRLNVEAKKEVAHRRVAGDHHLDDRARVARQRLDGPPQIAEKHPLEQPAAVLAVVANPRHDVRPAKALGVLERMRGQGSPALEIFQPQNDRRGPQVHCEAQRRPGDLPDLLAIPKQGALP